MFSIIVLVILGLSIGLPLGLLLNKSSSSSSMGWYNTKLELTGSVIDVEKIIYEGKSLLYYADNNKNGCSWFFDGGSNGYIERDIISTVTNNDMLIHLPKSSSGKYQVNILNVTPWDINDPTKANPLAPGGGMRLKYQG